MATISLLMFDKMRKYRWHHKDDEMKQRWLTDVISRSFSVVYGPDYMEQLTHCRKLFDKHNKRVARWKKYVADMIYTFEGNPCYLVTLTFGNCYESTTRDSRHKYVKMFLKKYFLDYMGCLDIGAEGREHYHVIGILKDDVSLFEETVISKKGRSFVELHFANSLWSYGFEKLKLIADSDKDLFRATRYAIKASGYATKATEFDSSIKPFHARGVVHWHQLKTDEELPF